MYWLSVVELLCQGLEFVLGKLYTVIIVVQTLRKSLLNNDLCIKCLYMNQLVVNPLHKTAFFAGVRGVCLALIQLDVYVF